MKQPTVMSHKFSEVPKAEIQRSRFDRSHGYKTTFDAGWLIPFYMDEALPGDTFNLKASAFARLATPLHPIMDNMYLETFFFFVPNRLVWVNWNKFCGEQDDPGDSISFTVPIFNASVIDDTLHDYMGLPRAVAGYTWSALHARAYNLIYNEWFRDENLQDSVVVDTGDANSTRDDYVLLRRGKRHDYFTSCLPWAQKGASVLLPLGTKAQIFHDVSDTATIGIWSTVNSAYHLMDTDAARLEGSAGTSAQAAAMYADLTTATAASINELRQSFQIQKLLERDARGGTRYTEIIKSHFGVTSPDARLQRPEYLGGGFGAC